MDGLGKKVAHLIKKCINVTLFYDLREKNCAPLKVCRKDAEEWRLERFYLPEKIIFGSFVPCIAYFSYRLLTAPIILLIIFLSLPLLLTLANSFQLQSSWRR